MEGARGQMLVISGPSGCGKSTLCQLLMEDPRLVFSISATTRPMRPGEADGRDYHFISTEAFRAHVDEGDFIEWAEVHGNLYGTLREPMERALAEGRVYLLEIDVQGANQLRRLGVPGLYVFVAPPSFEELERRLVGRGTDPPEVIERRLKKARDEYEERSKYDFEVLNEDLQKALAEIRTLARLDPPVVPGEGERR